MLHFLNIKEFSFSISSIELYLANLLILVDNFDIFEVSVVCVGSVYLDFYYYGKVFFYPSVHVYGSYIYLLVFSFVNEFYKY